MDVIIVGAGQAGNHIAQALTQENHNVTLIDTDRQRLDRAEEMLDVRTICDHGASPRVLDQAGVSDASLVAAVTNSDEVNLISAVTAKELGATLTAARVYNQAYHGGERVEYRNLLGIDLIISPQALAALEIAKLIENPAAVMVETFAQGRVQMREMVVRHDSAAAGRRIRDLFPPSRRDSALAVSVTRGDHVAVPGPDDYVKDGDLVTVVMPADSTARIRELFHETEAPARSVVIAGGGTTALMLAQTLEGRHKDVKLIEEDRARCDELSKALKRTQVIHGDATRQSVMEEERIGDADIFVAMCGEDEVNLMSALQAREMGVKHVTVTVNRADYAPLVERIGIQHAISPRILTGNRVLMLVGRFPILSAALLHEGKAEVIELMAEAKSRIAGHKLGDEVRLPQGTILGAIVRGEEVIVPRGGDIVLPGDTCIAFALSSSVDDLTRLFRGKR
jgi:trk system potassium uptake protein